MFEITHTYATGEIVGKQVNSSAEFILLFHKEIDLLKRGLVEEVKVCLQRVTELRTDYILFTKDNIFNYRWIEISYLKDSSLCEIQFILSNESSIVLKRISDCTVQKKRKFDWTSCKYKLIEYYDMSGNLFASLSSSLSYTVD